MNDKLDKEEFEAFQHPEHFEHMKRLVVRETIDSLDKDKDGMISEEEYFGKFYLVSFLFTCHRGNY